MLLQNLHGDGFCRTCFTRKSLDLDRTAETAAVLTATDTSHIDDLNHGRDAATLTTPQRCDKPRLIQMSAADASADAEAEQTCAICLEETALAALPCCDNATTTESTTRFCLECLRMNCDHGGGVARCPRCWVWISVEGDAVVAHDGTGKCSVCNQEPRVLVARGRAQAPDGSFVPVAICDACWLGRQIVLRYQCQQCGGIQRIPHPMWRYQEDGPESFGHTPWACHVRCGTFTC